MLHRCLVIWFGHCSYTVWQSSSKRNFALFLSGVVLFMTSDQLGVLDWDRFVFCLVSLGPSILQTMFAKKWRGKGTCKPSGNSTFLFECECNMDGSRLLQALIIISKFLPCAIPNCNLSLSLSLHVCSYYSELDVEMESKSALIWRVHVLLLGCFSMDITRFTFLACSICKG